MARKSRKTENIIEASIATQVLYNTALYVRLSVLDSGKKEGETILNQQEFLEQYVKEHPELTFVDVFVDNGETGVDFVRPAWNDLMRACRNGKINCIVIKDLSRLGRNYIETGDYLERILPTMGVRVIAINDQYDGLNISNGDRLISNLKNLVNDIYAKDISHKSSSALRMKQKEGAFIGSYASYGYVKDPNDKNKIIIDPDTAPVVKQIFEWKSNGVSTTQICRKLIELGISAPNKYRYDKGIVRHEKYANVEWAISVVHRILSSQVYLGHMVQGRKRGALYEGGGHKLIDESLWTIVENTHNPIVSQELFDKAASVMTERKQAYKKNEGKLSSFEKPEMILRGLVFCADCGKPLYRYKTVSKKQTKVYWSFQCRTHDTLMKCSYKYIQEKDLNNIVYEAILIELKKAFDLNKVIAKLSKDSSHKNRLSSFDNEIEEAERNIKRVSALRQAIYEDYVSKLLSVSEYHFATDKYTKELELFCNRLENAKLKKTNYKQNSTSDNKWLVAYSEFINERKLTTTIVNALIESIKIYDRNKVNIIFKFKNELDILEKATGFTAEEGVL